ncbi:MAG: hypothetical protein HQK51_15535 [Oligoflexia bacterium]|nr:hypothetical protein [Oligoflexia bacterium]
MNFKFYRYFIRFLIFNFRFITFYNRNRAVAEYCVKLKNLQLNDSQGYKYECNIHSQRGYNFLDNHPSEISQKVINDPEKWLKDNDNSCSERNTNAIAYLKNFTRNPIPNRIIIESSGI